MAGSDLPFDMGSPTPGGGVEAQVALGPAGRERVYRGTATEFLALGRVP